MPKRLTVLGSTGSIGQNVLKIVSQYPEQFSVVALTAKRNVERLAEQIHQFHPRVAVVFDDTSAEALKRLVPSGTKTEILSGEEGYIAAAAHESADMTVGAMMGAAGLAPTLAAIDAGKPVALANKETLVMAGEIVMNRAREKGVPILPVDSEHSAIFQCLQGQERKALSKILLTASGGPFRKTPASAFAAITPETALKHPNWEMGRKISIDSATLMNKGLEVIEAKWLFDVAPEQIEVVVHPQSIVHSMIAFRDGSVIGQMGVPDMRGAIAYALSYPARLSLDLPVPDFYDIGALTFEKPDMERFPCLSLAFSALGDGGTMPAVLNAANEVAVEAFLDQKIAFVQIPEIIRAVMDAHEMTQKPSLSAIAAADRQARAEAARQINQLFEKRS